MVGFGETLGSTSLADARPRTFTCSVLALAIPKRVASAFFQVGALAGALLLTFRIVRKPPRVNRLEPVQHKVRDLISLFEQGAMKQRDRDEVLISPVDLDICR